MTLVYIDHCFENGSPLQWKTDGEGIVHIDLLYDYERNSPNRAAGHWHFRIETSPGSNARIVLSNFDNIWNGKHGSPISDRSVCFVSTGDSAWRAVPAHKTADNRLELELRFEAPRLTLARLEPYQVSDLDRLLQEIETHPHVEITPIGKTVEGRELEIVRIGQPSAPYRVLIRARAHSWEPGGNWVVQGLIRGLLENNEKNTKFLARCCVYVLPMAEKDGVMRGRTRFNSRGMDLNRGWERPADPELAPENSALECWLEALVGSRRAPQLMIDLHNDNSGRLHVSRRDNPGDRHVARMRRLETVLREHTWFTEGIQFSTPGSPWTVGQGLLERYGIDACVLELNCDWIAGLGTPPFGGHWETFGRQLRDVFKGYFAD